MKKKKIGLSFLVIALALSVAFSFVAISHLLLKTGKQNPYANIDVSASDSDNNNSNNNINKDTNNNILSCRGNPVVCVVCHLVTSCSCTRSSCCYRCLCCLL